MVWSSSFIGQFSAGWIKTRSVNNIALFPVGKKPAFWEEGFVYCNGVFDSNGYCPLTRPCRLGFHRWNTECCWENRNRQIGREERCFMEHLWPTCLFFFCFLSCLAVLSVHRVWVTLLVMWCSYSIRLYSGLTRGTMTWTCFRSNLFILNHICNKQWYRCSIIGRRSHWLTASQQPATQTMNNNPN